MAYDDIGISNFKSKFLDGLRPNLFYVQLTGDVSDTKTIPASENQQETTTSFSVGGLDNFQFYCKAASLPASSIGSIEVPYMGRSIKVAGNRTFEDWTVTVYNAVLVGKEDSSSSKSLRLPFEQWMALINSHDANTGFNRIGSYRKTATIHHLDQRGNTIASYVMHGIFPTEVSSIDLAWDSNDTIEEFTVTFALGDYWLLANVENSDIIEKGVSSTSSYTENSTIKG